MMKNIVGLVKVKLMTMHYSTRWSRIDTKTIA